MVETTCSLHLDNKLIISFSSLSEKCLHFHEMFVFSNHKTCECCPDCNLFVAFRCVLNTFLTRRDLKAMKFILSAFPDYIRRGIVSMEDNQGRVLLGQATLHGLADIVEYLLVECNAPTAQLVTDTSRMSSRFVDVFGEPLWVACKLGHLNVVKLLVKHGASLEMPSSDSTRPLHIAAREERDEVAHYLVECGADINAATSKGQTPLFFASRDLSEFFIEHGAKVNHKSCSGMSAMTQAVEANDVKKLKLLLEHGANLEKSSSNDVDCLTYAAICGKSKILSYLIKEADLQEDTKLEPARLAGLYELLGLYHLMGQQDIFYDWTREELWFSGRARYARNFFSDWWSEDEYKIASGDFIHQTAKQCFLEALVIRYENDCTMKINDTAHFYGVKHRLSKGNLDDFVTVCRNEDGRSADQLRRAMWMWGEILNPDHQYTISLSAYFLTLSLACFSLEEAVKFYSYFLQLAPRGSISCQTKTSVLSRLLSRCISHVNQEQDHKMDSEPVLAAFNLMMEESKWCSDMLRSRPLTHEQESAVEEAVEAVFGIMQLIGRFKGSNANQERAQAVLNTWVPLSLTTPNGTTLLHFVARHLDDQENFTFFQFLLKKGMKVNAIDRKRNTPLHLFLTPMVNEANFRSHLSSTELEVLWPTVATKTQMMLRYGAHLDACNDEGISIQELISKVPISGIELPEVSPLQCLAARVIRTNHIPMEALPRVLFDFVLLHRVVSRLER